MSARSPARGSGARLSARAILVWTLLATLVSACDSDTDAACQNVGNCTHGGSDDWVTACREQNDELADEADAVGCHKEFDAYFACAEKHFSCRGNESSFPGCEPSLAAYSACLAGKASGTACAELAAGLTECEPAAAPPHDPELAASPCTASGDCSAHCYLDSVPNLCAPLAAELAAFADCASHCVF